MVICGNSFSVEEGQFSKKAMTCICKMKSMT